MAHKLPLVEEKRRDELFRQGLHHCTKCKADKPVAEFSKSKSRKYGLYDWCKSCQSIKRKGNYFVKRKARQRAADFTSHYKTLAGGSCKKCGYDQYLAALDFHHVEADKKQYTPSVIVSRGADHDMIMSEIELCILLCSNCHRGFTAGNWEAVFIKGEWGYNIEPGSIVETPDEKATLPDKYRYSQNGFEI